MNNTVYIDGESRFLDITGYGGLGALALMSAFGEPVPIMTVDYNNEFQNARLSIIQELSRFGLSNFLRKWDVMMIHNPSLGSFCNDGSNHIRALSQHSMRFSLICGINTLSNPTEDIDIQLSYKLIPLLKPLLTTRGGILLADQYTSFQADKTASFMNMHFHNDGPPEYGLKQSSRKFNMPSLNTTFPEGSVNALLLTNMN